MNKILRPEIVNDIVWHDVNESIPEDIQTVFVVGYPTEDSKRATLILGFGWDGYWMHYHANPLGEIISPKKWAYIPDKLCDEMWSETTSLKQCTKPQPKNLGKYQ